MSEQEGPAVGSLVGFDLTVENAEDIRDFYSAVVGWKTSPVDMGGYDDYMMLQPADDKPAAGVVWARGVNADQPRAQWIAYIQVASLTDSVNNAVELGGSIVIDRRAPGNEWPFVVIKDPAGAMLALMGPE